jgi:hypothetical protein
MAETLEAPIQTTEQPAAETQVTFNPFKADSWVEAPSPVQNIPLNAPAPAAENVVPTVVDTPVETVVTPPVEEEIFDENDFIKSKFGFDTTEEAVKQFNELKAAKERGFEFSNDDSRRIFEYIKENKIDDLYNVLDQQRKVNKLLSAENIDDAIAEQMIKMGMQAKYKDLTSDEIDYKFRKQFGVPAAPVQDTVNESDEDFAIRKSTWEDKVKDVKMEMMIEAKLSKPELQKLKTELVLPDIKRNNPNEYEPSAEVLAEAQKAREKFLTTLNSGFQNFKGYETKVKDGSVEIPVSFAVPEEEKIAQRVKIEGIEDIVQYFNQRWFDVNQNLNAEKIMADLYLLENPEKVFQGIANNAASQRLVEHMRASSNIKIDNGSGAQTTTQKIESNGHPSIQEQIAGLWKQKY